MPVLRTANKDLTVLPSADLDAGEEIADIDVPPERSNSINLMYAKAPPQLFGRRESLLTRQLHSETDHSEDDHAPPARALSTQSNCSAASTAELTSDDGRSVPSPGISPPLPATRLRSFLPIVEKPLTNPIKIVSTTEPDRNIIGPEQSVEAGLGRRRCITFACGNKQQSKPSPPLPTSQPEAQQVASLPKRKCTIQFACPSRPSELKPISSGNNQGKRAVSPPPPERRISAVAKTHRGSDSTVTHVSPKSLRKQPVTIATAPTPTIERPILTRRISSDHSGTEAMRFHEFATSDDEPEEWIQESTVHRSRLTISDTLQKENVIRKACEEVEEEVLEEEDEEDEEEEDHMDESPTLNDGDETLRQDGEEEDDESDSDDGFHSDDEGGFAESDESDGEDSDYEWWKPGGRSTAATSVEQLDRLSLPKKPEDEVDLASSLGSVSSGNMSPRSSRLQFHKKTRKLRGTHAVPIQRPEAELPDSTDFVAGTLDEDRPLEEAFINSRKDREAAKHKARPQDIDPTFPTSDPEMDEEDDDDLLAPEPSDGENMVHGDMEELHGGSTARPSRSPRGSRRSTMARSPAPTTRLRSPPPPARLASPPPKGRRQLKSPPPPTKRAVQAVPSVAGDPPPSKANKAILETPRAVFPQSKQHQVSHVTFGLPERFATHTASLPRAGGFLSKLKALHADDEGEGSDTASANPTEIPKRGAIDIVEGLARKRQRRKEKMYQKMCQKAAAKGEKPYKVKPGKGAERMREVGLELQRYKGRGEHIISF